MSTDSPVNYDMILKHYSPIKSALSEILSNSRVLVSWAIAAQGRSVTAQREQLLRNGALSKGKNECKKIIKIGIVADLINSNMNFDLRWKNRKPFHKWCFTWLGAKIPFTLSSSLVYTRHPNTHAGSPPQINHAKISHQENQVVLWSHSYKGTACWADLILGHIHGPLKHVIGGLCSFP